MAQLFLNQSKYHPLYSTGEQMKVAKKKKRVVYWALQIASKWRHRIIVTYLKTLLELQSVRNKIFQTSAKYLSWWTGTKFVHAQAFLGTILKFIKRYTIFLILYFKCIWQLAFKPQNYKLWVSSSIDKWHVSSSRFWFLL